MPDYEISTLPEAEARTPELDAYGDALRRGFHLNDSSDDTRQRWLDDSRVDGARLRAAYPSAPGPDLPPHTPVATFISLDGTLNAGADPVALNLITEVTVRPTHRRRGLLRALMTEDLAQAKEAGTPLAGLTASEATIYGRFGFGVATDATRVRVDTRRAHLDVEPDGRLEIADSRSAGDALAASFDRFHAATRGSVSRPSFYRDYLTGAWNYDTQGAWDQLRVALHRDEAGELDGHVVYEVKQVPPSPGQAPLQTAVVHDLVATDPAVELQLWSFLTQLDLVQAVTFGKARPAGPLLWALADRRALRVESVDDFLWLRVLDVPGALGARGWDAEGAASFEVMDDLGHAAGCWDVRVTNGVAEVRPASEASVRMPARALASLYLGLVDARTLAGAGQLAGDAADIGRLARLFSVATPPYCLTAF